jgi:phage tail protein X
MSLYRTKDGDRIDLIVLEHYGNLNHLNDVLSLNTFLFNLPLDLKAGLDIDLPDFTEEVVKETKNERGPLW